MSKYNGVPRCELKNKLMKSDMDIQFHFDKAEVIRKNIVKLKEKASEFLESGKGADWAKSQADLKRS